MTRRDRGLERVGTEGAELLGAIEGGQTPVDEQVIPAGAVLIEEQDRIARGTGAGPQARRLDLHQGDEPVDLRLLGHERGQDPAEAEFTFQGATLFRDLETGEELEIDPAAVRDNYLHKMRELNEFYRKGMTEAGVAYQRVDTRQSYDALLSSYLARRTRTRR